MKEILLPFLIGYLLGSLPSAYLISKKFKNIDIRNVGDKNPGARNVFKNVGKLCGTLTFILDFLKGAIPVFFFYYLFKEPNLALISGIGAVTGHAYPLFLKFYGGKSISTIYGIFFALFPVQTLISLLLFLIFFKFKRHFDHSLAFSFICFIILLFITKTSRIKILYSMCLMVFIGIKKMIDLPRERLI